VRGVLPRQRDGSAAAVRGAGGFGDAMLAALDKVSADQQFAANLEQQAIIDPDSVDAHDITIAQAKARMSLDIARNVLSRIVQGWKDLINTR
jgi:flagellar hook-basal body complex protein FliE